ncbi:hypothetical protein Emag_004694 [Eimeria magna]
MGKPEPQSPSRSGKLRRRRQAPVELSCGDAVSARSASDADTHAETGYPRDAVAACLSNEHADEVYSKHAAEFTEKFRASIDYSIREKPLQVLVGFGMLCILVLVSCTPSWLSEAAEGRKLFDRAFEDLSLQRQQELRFCALQIFGCLTVAIAGYCFLESRDGLLVRPHPGFWRLVHGLCLMYFLMLVALLAMHRDDGRFFIRVLAPGLGARNKNVFSGTLVLDCSVSKKTLFRQLTSLWFISHAIGWFLKMCIFRSWMFNLTFSVLFEFCEMSLQWLIPEFQECWWDSIFLDAIFSNLMGMVFGCAVMRWFGKRHFDWLGAYPTYQKILLKFTPFSSCNYEWSFFRTPRHLLMTSLLLFFSLLAEINVFLLMTVLDIPASHWINPLRLVFLGLLAFPAVAEFYAQVHFKYDRMGGNVFLYGIILAVELLVSVKYGADRFKSATPGADVVIPWLSTALLFGTWCRCYFTKLPQEQGKETEAKRDAGAVLSTSLRDSASSVLLKVPPQACFLPLLYLFKHYYYGSA